ncbi:SUPPRESSOR OF TY 5 [Salix viminalis]|uniref:SUPPRESSOR OF TY 5 n=1 Tax=Salix viminalis TaxID=40686 RepID=A0A9Q0SBB7_SALVM|nr:SUPPRESSOR OF TY 5 [Salix viminalis]
MARRRDEDDDLEDEEYEEQEEQLMDEEEEYEEEEEDRGASIKKRRRSDFIDDIAEEEDEEEEDDDDDEDYGGGGGVASDDEEEEEDAEDDFIVDDHGADLPDEAGGRRMHRPLLSREDDQEDVEALERSIQARYAKSMHSEYDEETTEVEQQALLPSVRDPKLWMVKCAIGRERETAVCLMQKYIDKGSELQIRSVVALDHLKNFIYIEADKEAHVREACKGLRNIFGPENHACPNQRND